MNKKEALKCPLCGGKIKKVSGDTPMIKCEKNIYSAGQQSGCTFFMSLSPKPLGGYTFSRDEIASMLNGETVEVDGIKAQYDREVKFNPNLIFPPLEDF